MEKGIKRASSLHPPNMTPEQIAFVENLFKNPKEGLEWTKKTFDKLKDESGTIPKESFGPKIKEVAMSLGAPEPVPEDLEAAIERVDINKDGKIVFEEFVNFCVGTGDGLLILLGLKK